MPLVDVHNDNVVAHVEEYKGDRITIPAKGSIKMEWEEAIQFAGQFTGITKPLPDGNPDPRGFKMIRVDRPSEPIFKDDLTCHADGKKAATKADLEAMLEKYGDRRVTDPEAESEAKSELAQMRAQNAALEARLAALEDKRGPGRPRKDEAASA